MTVLKLSRSGSTRRGRRTDNSKSSTMYTVTPEQSLYLKANES